MADVSSRPLHIIGKAKLVHLNARKEGPEDEKILASDLKFALTTSSDFLIYFHSQLRLMLFTKEGDPRFPLMGPVDWDYEFLNMKLTVDPMTLDPELRFHGVKLKKWVFQPKKGGKVDVSFSAQVKPDRQEFGIIGRALIAEEVTLTVLSENGDLFEEEPTAGQKAARAAAATRTEEQLPLVEPAPPAGQWEDDGGPAPAEAEEAPPPEIQPTPPPTELNDGMLHFLRAAGAAEALKLEDDRDFDAGLAAALGSSGLPKDFIDEHRLELEGAYTDGYEEEMNKAEGQTNG